MRAMAATAPGPAPRAPQAGLIERNALHAMVLYAVRRQTFLHGGAV